MKERFEPKTIAKPVGPYPGVFNKDGNIVKGDLDLSLLRDRIVQVQEDNIHGVGKDDFRERGKGPCKTSL